MPWSIRDVDKHKKNLTRKQKKQWVAVLRSTINEFLVSPGSPLCPLLRERVFTFESSNEHSVLQVDGNRCVFHIALAFDAFDDFFACQRTFTLEYTCDDVAHDPWLVAPFLECVESAADEYEASVLDELIMSRCGVSLTPEKLLNTLGDLREVHWGAVAFEGEVCKIARILDAHMRGILPTPLAERIAADAF